MFVSNVNNIKLRYVKLLFDILLFFFLFIQFAVVVSRVIPYTTYALGLKNTAEFKNYYYVQEPYIFYDPTGRVKNEVGTQKLIVKGTDLIFPVIQEFNAKDYSFANLDRQVIYTFRTLKDEMLRNGYKYILTNRDSMQDHFAIWFKENEYDKVDSYFDLVIHEKTQFGTEWFLYKVREY